jgi:murein DD-endopeptidase MepM/ murein hydrolase activator NlpD
MYKTSSFGERTDAQPTDHDGIDLRAEKGTPVYAAESGVIKEADIESPRSRGKNSYLIIDHGKGYETRYLHLDSFSVKAGDKVRKGQYIGLSGTRNNAAPHLHFEIRKNNIPKNSEYFIGKIPGRN